MSSPIDSSQRSSHALRGSEAKNGLICPRTWPCDGAPRLTWGAGFWEHSLAMNMCWATNEGHYLAERQSHSVDFERTRATWCILTLRATCQSVPTSSICHGGLCPLFSDILKGQWLASVVPPVVVEFHSSCSEVDDALWHLW